MSKIQLCEPCLAKIREAAARGGRAGSREDKIAASKLGAQVRQANAARLTFNGKTLSVSEWSKRTGIPKRTIWRKLRKKMPLFSVLTPQPHGAEHLPT